MNFLLPEHHAIKHHLKTACPPRASTLQLWPFFQLLLTGSFGLASTPIYKNISTFSQRGAVHDMGFIRDFVTAVDSVLNLLSFSCSFLQLLLPGPSSSRLYHQSTNTETLWQLTSYCVTSALLAQPWDDTAPPTRLQNASPVLRGISLRTGTGETHVSTAPRYVWSQDILFFL